MQSICFFSAYFNSPTLPYYIQFYLERLRPYFTEIILLTNDDKKLNIDSVKFLGDNDIKIKYFNNEGWDFGMWQKAILVTETDNYDRIALVNDSCVLFKNPESFFLWLENIDSDFCGMVDSNYPLFHLQSYFLVINKNAISEVRNFFVANSLEKNVLDVINKFEIGLSQHLLKKGYSVNACYSTSTYNGEFSPAFFMPLKLIDKGFPLIKKKIFFCSFRRSEFINLFRMKYIFFPSHYVDYIKSKNKDQLGNLIDFKKVNKSKILDLNFFKINFLTALSFIYQFARKFKNDRS